MSSTETASHETHPSPVLSDGGHPLPGRSSPETSVTIRHHRRASEASVPASPGSGVANSINSPLPVRRNSSAESRETGCSDANNWFEQSNRNPSATFDSGAMDADPPFFQKESDSSNEDRPYSYRRQAIPPRPVTAQSSSADDYRSVIDDLTVEIQKLKEELKRYKQKGPEMLRKDKLFEIKIHGLPKRKKRELETTLRDFAASLGDSHDAPSSQRKKSSRHASRDHLYPGSGSFSKHASSSSGSKARPTDSAYASMSTGAKSSGTSLGRPPVKSARARSSEQKVESYLRDIPEGLYPRHVAMTEKDKKQLVVRRLEQLFTGKIGGRHVRRTHRGLEDGGSTPAGESLPQVHQPPSLPTVEASREAKILPPQRQSGISVKKSILRDNVSASISNGDQTDSCGNGNGNGGGLDTSTSLLADQRPTRPKDLDPNRVQVPSENMDYIRHLGLIPPELLTDETLSAPNVHPDAEGWVYLNLLCNLAQLHMINVTPSFVRSAVSEMSTKFQLSPDGRQIRWQGGTEGTKFFSDSSGDNSQRSPDTDDTTTSKKANSRKRRKTVDLTGVDFQSSSSKKNPSKFGPQVSNSSESFHYKPLFIQQDSPNGEMSPDGTLSSVGPVEDSNLGESRWGLSGSGESPANRRKRRHDGAIIYYSGAPFCTDLSGDPGDLSPATYMLAGDQIQEEPPTQLAVPSSRPPEPALALSYRPLSHVRSSCSPKMDVDSSDDMPGLTTDSGDDSGDLEFDTPWTSEPQYIELRPLEPCGLGGVLPDDHFMVVVTTKRPQQESRCHDWEAGRVKTDEATDSIVGRLAIMTTSSPAPLMSKSSSQAKAPAVEIEYVSGRIKRLAPVPLPPPAIFLPPFSNDSTSVADTEMWFEGDGDESESLKEYMSRRANPHQSDGT